MDRIRSGGTGRLHAPSRPSGRPDDGPETARETRTEEGARLEADRRSASGADRLQGGGGDMGGEPWGQGGRGVYSNGCVAGMFAREWAAQRPDEFRAAAADLREGREVEINGQTIKLDDTRRATVERAGMLGSDEAVVEAALLGFARSQTGQNAEGGTDADGVAVLEQTLQLGVNLAEGGDAQPGDYVAVGTGDDKHFMKVTGRGADGFHLQDAYGNSVTMSSAELARSGQVDDGDNLGGWTGVMSTGASSSKRR